MNVDPLLFCPKCRSEFRSNSLECVNCSFEGQIRDGIPSFVSGWSDHAAKSSDWLDTETLERLELAIERESIETAVPTVLDGHEFESAVVSEIFDVRRDDWRVLVSEQLSGRCLDICAGYGRRSHLLSEIVDEVYAVDPSLAKLRVLAARDDYESGDNVFPVHANFDQVPFRDEAFNSVVADLTGQSVDTTDECVQSLSRTLHPDGTLFLVVDGWTQRTGVLRRLGLERGSPTESRDLLRATLGRYRSILRSHGFNLDRTVALFPTVGELQYAFDVGNQSAVSQLTSSFATSTVTMRSIGAKWLSLLDRFGLLKRCYPNYLLMARRSGVDPLTSQTAKIDPFEFNNPLLVSGRARAVVLDPAGGDLTRVWKIPNRAAHEEITARESLLLEELRATDKPIVETLPAGETVPTRFGATRLEQPVSGLPLDDRCDGSLASVDETLRIGFDWLIEFQQTFRREGVVLEPEEVEKQLTVDRFNLPSPDIEEPVEVFTTPVHGDLHPQNVYVQNGTVSTVIDWEYGAITGNPITDAAFFALKTTQVRAGSVPGAVDELFVQNSDLSALVWEHVDRYCSAVGLSQKTFQTYFPYPYIRRVTNDMYNGVTDHVVRSTMNRWEGYIRIMNEQRFE